MILNISSLKEHGWHKFSVACTNPSKANVCWLCNYSISSLGLDEIERPVFGNSCARDTLFQFVRNYRLLSTEKQILPILSINPKRTMRYSNTYVLISRTEFTLTCQRLYDKPYIYYSPEPDISLYHCFVWFSDWYDS